MSFSQELITQIKAEWLEREAEQRKLSNGPWKSPDIETKSHVHHPYDLFQFNKVACILMAGWVSSRLNSDVPKGMTPIPPSGKTLFEIFFRRFVGFWQTYQQWPFIAIMTSKDTDDQTKKYLLQHDFFGVPSEQVSFFLQDSLPMLDEKGDCLEENGTLIFGPNGNGLLFKALQQSGISQNWEEEKVQACTIMNIDNPLMDPFLPILFQPVLEREKDAAISVITRSSEHEKAGIILEKNKHIHVVEYSEVPHEIQTSRDSVGVLSYPLANISVFCIKRQAIETLSQLVPPLHFAKKFRKGKTIYKPEYFIFDLFPYFEKPTLVQIDRKRYFSPIKSRTGEDSLEEGSLAFSFLQQEQAERKHLTLLAKVDDPSELDPAILYGV